MEEDKYEIVLVSSFKRQVGHYKLKNLDSLVEVHFT